MNLTHFTSVKTGQHTQSVILQFAGCEMHAQVKTCII